MDDLDTAQRLSVDALAEAYRIRYGTAVEWVKSEVGDGAEYTNDAARAVLSHNGAWCECIDLPMEFSGVTGGPVPYRFVGTDQALALLERLQAAGEEAEEADPRVLDLLVLYTRAGIVDGRGAYVLRAMRTGGAGICAGARVGAYRPGQMPLFFRCRVDGTAGCEESGTRRGVVFVIAQPGGRHLLAVLPHEGQCVADLGAPVRGDMPQ